MSWRPILNDDESARAWTAIRGVAEFLDSQQPDDPGLPDGSAGIALFFTYLGNATQDERWLQSAHRFAGHAIDALAERPLPPALHGGFTGIGWTLEHLHDSLFDEDDEEDEEEDEDDPIGESLIELLERPAKRGEFDLITGLTGYGVYALEALPRPAARRCVELVLERLTEIADANGVWFSPPDVLPDHQRESAPAGLYNLGVAHGVPAVIAFLGEAVGKGFDAARPMLERAVEWLLAQKRAGTGWCFPSWVADGVKPFPSRAAWCYGDPGVAASLFVAARHAHRDDWEREAIEIAQRAANRPMEHALVVDAGLCHGSAGLGHMFNRMHQASGDAVLRDAARAWFAQALDQRNENEGAGAGGFLAWAPLDPNVPRFAPAPGFLLGAAGVALALLAAVTPLEPAWDRSLAISVPLAPAATT